MAELRIRSDDALELRRLATDLAESQGWPRERISIWDTREGEVIVTVDEEVLHPAEPDPLRRPVYTRSDVHRACELLRRRDSSLRGVTFPGLRDEAARFFSAGWTVADLLHALAYRPDGVAWPQGEGYQGIEWLEHRLRKWKTPSGDIRPSLSQETSQMRIVGQAGLPDDLGMPTEESRRGQAARPEVARAAADDARRLMRVQTRTTSNTLEHRDRTASHIGRYAQPEH
ncbi:hypothetical protein [Salinactinospora qingdaonensis]|uniref:Uncharacterized protein n=1 Tax=Salinactinospora qingdaonensis TaxID=702744 RepID=A0ABP7EV33_9ACTN